MKRGPSPVERTLKKLRADLWDAEKVEQWIPFPQKPGPRTGPPGVRRDLFGFVDVVAFKQGEGILFVQATAGGSHPIRHVDKLCAVKGSQKKAGVLVEVPGVYFRVFRALRAGIRVEIHAWRKLKVDGRERWRRRRICLSIPDEMDWIGGAASLRYGGDGTSIKVVELEEE